MCVHEEEKAERLLLNDKGRSEDDTLIADESTSSTFDDYSRQFSKKRTVRIKVPSDQLQIEYLRFNKAILIKIKFFAGIQYRSTRLKFYVRLTEEMP